MEILVELVNKYVIVNEVCSPERSVNDVEYEFVSPSIGQRKSRRTLVFHKSTHVVYFKYQCERCIILF